MRCPSLPSSDDKTFKSLRMRWSLWSCFFCVFFFGKCSFFLSRVCSFLSFFSLCFLFFVFLLVFWETDFLCHNNRKKFWITHTTRKKILCILWRVRRWRRERARQRRRRRLLRKQLLTRDFRRQKRRAKVAAWCPRKVVVFIDKIEIVLGKMCTETTSFWEEDKRSRNSRIGTKRR